MHHRSCAGSAQSPDLRRRERRQEHGARMSGSRGGVELLPHLLLADATVDVNEPDGWPMSQRQRAPESRRLGGHTGARAILAPQKPPWPNADNEHYVKWKQLRWAFEQRGLLLLVTTGMRSLAIWSRQRRDLRPSGHPLHPSPRAQMLDGHLVLLDHSLRNQRTVTRLWVALDTEQRCGPDARQH